MLRRYSRWIGAELSTIATREFAPYSPRVRLNGPQVLLEPSTAQTIAVILHELATNAAKYGALSAANGQIDLQWSHEAGGRLHLRWTETGGLAVAKVIEFAQRSVRAADCAEYAGAFVKAVAGEAEEDWR